jgi:hypothetical protein
MRAYLLVGKHYQAPGRTGKRKFEIKRQGPFPILRVLGNGNAVDLDVPTHSQIHPIVSIEQIEPAPHGPDPFGREVPQPSVPKLARKLKPPKITQILDRRYRALGEGPHAEHVEEFLVRREGRPLDEATWEDTLLVDRALIRQYYDDHGLDLQD